MVGNNGNGTNGVRGRDKEGRKESDWDGKKEEQRFSLNQTEVW